MVEKVYMGTWECRKEEVRLGCGRERCASRAKSRGVCRRNSKRKVAVPRRAQLGLFTPLLRALLVRAHAHRRHWRNLSGESPRLGECSALPHGSAHAPPSSEGVRSSRDPILVPRP